MRQVLSCFELCTDNLGVQRTLVAYRQKSPPSSKSVCKTAKGHGASSGVVTILLISYRIILPIRLLEFMVQSGEPRTVHKLRTCPRDYLAVSTRVPIVLQTRIIRTLLAFLHRFGSRIPLPYCIFSELNVIGIKLAIASKHTSPIVYERARIAHG